jgi:hypothetical protein
MQCNEIEVMVLCLRNGIINKILFVLQGGLLVKQSIVFKKFKFFCSEMVLPLKVNALENDKLYFSASGIEISTIVLESSIEIEIVIVMFVLQGV